MAKALIIVILAILAVVGIRYYAPAAEPVATEVVEPASAAELEIDAVDLGADIDASLDGIDADLNSL